MSDDHAAARPTLPAECDGLSSELRRRQLDIARAHYETTTGTPSLPGVPVVSYVPREEEPTVAWLLDVGRVATEAVLNAVLASGAMHVDDSSRLTGALHNHGLPAPADLARITRLATHLVELERLALDPRHHDLDLPVRLRRELEDLASLTYRHLKPAEADRLGAYVDLFRSLPLPEIAGRFLEDETFAHMRVAGPNPMVLCRQRHPHPLVPVDDDAYRRTTGDTTDLATAMAEGRVFVADYHELQDLVPAPLDGRERHVLAPIALFAVPRGARSLVPVAIRCGRTDHDAVVLRAVDGEDPWRWRVAKTMVQVADTCHHELFVHLARTHLVMEAVALATHRELATEHPLHALLRPHLDGTLFINAVAADRLIGAGGPISRLFAGTIASVQSATANDRLSYDLRRAHVPDDLAHRGIDDPETLPDHPYRDDAMRVWDALERWVGDYLGVYYADDDAMHGDTELQAWHRALVHDVHLRGVMPLDGVSDLVDLVTSLVFTASAQHAAVNFPQRPDMSFAPAFTGAAWASPYVERPDEAAWLAMLPPLDLALEQATLLTVLGSVVHRPLGEYQGYGPLGGPWFRDARIVAPDGPLERFRTHLDAVEAEIEAANRHRRPYTFLLPSRIPASVNI
ncbi:MAG: hypothetical protein H6733_13125 [Alphaproteobacteria bacterium]|nr:hypothetical protein [Alphaproteobacteria bacterium]